MMHNSEMMKKLQSKINFRSFYVFLSFRMDRSNGQMCICEWDRKTEIQQQQMARPY